MAADGEEQREEEGVKEGGEAPGLSHCLCGEVQEYEEMTIAEIMTGKSTYETTFFLPPSLPSSRPPSFPPFYRVVLYPSLPPSLPAGTSPASFLFATPIWITSNATATRGRR